MAQQVLVGLIAAMAVLAAAILTLVGVLITTRTNFKLGKRTGDLAEQTADGARIAQLVEECKGLRAEITAQWKTNQELRQGCELADTQHESEKDGWTAEKDKLLVKIKLLLSQAEEARQVIDRAEAERDIALEGQASAEGGLTATQKTISCISATLEDISQKT